LAARRANWQPPAPKVSRGALAKYALLVGSASDGATTHPDTHVTPRPQLTETVTEGVTA
ncbi:MAG: dihydroxy-acid dehydratase, partial [Rhodanobacter sp.]